MRVDSWCIRESCFFFFRRAEVYLGKNSSNFISLICFFTFIVLCDQFCYFSELAFSPLNLLFFQWKLQIYHMIWWAFTVELVPIQLHHCIFNQGIPNVSKIQKKHRTRLRNYVQQSASSPLHWICGSFCFQITSSNKTLIVFLVRSEGRAWQPGLHYQTKRLVQWT